MQARVTRGSSDRVLLQTIKRERRTTLFGTKIVENPVEGSGSGSQRFPRNGDRQWPPGDHKERPTY
jgi:hypothetical protein